MSAPRMVLMQGRTPRQLMEKMAPLAWMPRAPKLAIFAAQSLGSDQYHFLPGFFVMTFTFSLARSRVRAEIDFEPASL